MRRVLLTLSVLSVTAVGPAAQRGADVASALEKGDWQTYSGRSRPSGTRRSRRSRRQMWVRSGRCGCISPLAPVRSKERRLW
jgi:hypothetical protein